jgi:protein-arginine deiminase
MSGTTVRFDVDSDRDGRLERGEPGRWEWRYGPDAPGAIALPDLGQSGAAGELTPLRLVVENVPQDVVVHVGISDIARQFVTVYALASDGSAKPILGVVGDATRSEYGPIDRTLDLALQPHQLPGLGFDHAGYVELTAMVHRRDTNGDLLFVGADRTVLRVSPWIMTPNTCEPVRVYVVAIPGDTATGNHVFVEELAAACGAAGVELRQIDTSRLPSFAREPYDRWIQDEVEFGYVDGPAGARPVVVDGPRNRGLDTVGASGQLGEGLGVLLLDADFQVAGSLDAFGNLEVSPPVTVGGRQYPLGRIVLGTRQPGDDAGRKAALRLRQFLYAQGVQAPFDVYTDWLGVGHVDEVLSFVPAEAHPGFRVLIASPDAARSFFAALPERGLGGATLWRGQRRAPGAGTAGDAEETVEELLANDALWSYNDECARHVADVEAELRRKLGLRDEHLLRIPVLFEKHGGGAGAYFPDMVNHLVLGDVSVVPRPYGPLDEDGTDLLERAFRDAVPGQEVHFVDDWLSYHKLSGEVHCGTNVLRKPIEGVRWWEHEYDGLYNAWASHG